MPIPNIFGKMASMVLGQSDATQGAEQQIREARLTNTRREGREGIHSLLLEFRAHLLNAVANDIDVQPIIQGFVQLDIPLKEKFLSLHVTELLRKNCESVEGLKHIHSGLGTIIRYAKYLIKNNRQEQWRTISFKNVIVQRKILPLNGFSQVLSQLGYSEVTEFGQSFPSGKDPDKNAVVSLIADMELFRGELKIYCSGRHLHPESIGQYLPQELRDELEERQASDLSMMESTDTWTGSGSSQEGHMQSTEIQEQGPTKSVSGANQECNNNNNSNDGSKQMAKAHSNSSSSRNQHVVPSQVAAEASTPQNVPLVVEEVAQASQEETGIKDENSAIPDIVQNLDISGQDTALESPSETSTSNKLLCSVCGEDAVFLCRECYDNQMALCENCNKSWHKRQDRRHHNPQPISRYHRPSLESSGSLPSAHLRFDEHYGIMAASKQSRIKEEQTSVVKVSKFGQGTQPTPDHSVLFDRDLRFSPNPQAAGSQQHHPNQNQAQYGPVGNSLQYQFQQPPQSLSQHNQQLQQQHQQQIYRGHNQYQQQQQMPATYRLQGQNLLYNPSVMPSFVAPSTPRFSQPQGMNLILSSTTNSNTEFVGISPQLQGQNTMAGRVYPSSSTAGTVPPYPYMATTGDGPGGPQHQFQQQQQTPSLPPYVQAQLAQPNIQYQGPRWMTPVSQPFQYNSPMSLAYHQQYRQRLTYPHQGNTTNIAPPMFGTPSSHMYNGVPNVHQHAPYSIPQIQDTHHAPYSLQQMGEDTSQPPQAALHQSMLLQNHPALRYPGSTQQGLPTNHIAMSPQQNIASGFIGTAAGAFPGLIRPNSDMKLGHSGPALRMLGTPDSQRGLELAGQNVSTNAQETSQQVTPLRYPHPGVSESSVSPCQSPFISAPSSPLSSPPPSSPASSSEYIKKLLVEQDLTKRIKLCDHFIRNITADTKALQKEMLEKMEHPGSFSTTPECREMHRRMEEMVKEKSRLQSFKENLNCQVSHFYRGVESGNIEPEIYYPPDINAEEANQTLPAAINDSSPIKIIQDQREQLNVLVDNRQTAKLLPAHLPSPETPGSVHTPTNAGQGSRVPVEDSIPENISNIKDSKADTPPALPPRSSKPAANTNVLAMTIPAPNIPRSPSPTARMWVCEHCTLLNPINVHACQVCHRTTDNPKLVNGNGEECKEGGLSRRDSLQVEEENEEEEKSSEEDMEKEDKFIAYLTELKNEINPKKPVLMDEDDDDDLQLWEIEDTNDDTTGERQDSTVGQRIIGSQKQVMEEKRRAKEEFELREQQQAVMAAASASPGLTGEKDLNSTPVNVCHAGSSSTATSTCSAYPLFGVGARPKNNMKIPVNPAISNIMNSNKPSSHSKVKSSLQEEPHVPSDTGEKHHSDSIEESLARMEELKSIDSLQTGGAQLTQLIKMADLEDFDIQAVQIAIEICESMKGKIEPLSWLRANWRKNVAKIAAQACKLGKESSPNSIGEVSFEEAEVAYISCQGNMKEAAEKCVRERQALYEKLSALTEDFPREEILEAMLYCKGDAEAAQTRLVKAKLEPFADRIWQQSTEATNISGLLSSNPLSSSNAPTAASLIQGLVSGIGNLAVSQSVSVTGSPTNRGAVNMVGINPRAVDPCQCFATSVIGHQQFQDMMRDKAMDKDRRVRMIYVEGRLHSWGRADMVIKILDQDAELQQDLDEGHVTLEDVVEAVRDCQDRTSALAYLRQECQICFGRFPMNKIHNLNICQCRLCQECLVSHFEVAIREKHVRHWVCPQCSQPDLSDLDVASNYLQFLGMQLQPMISQDLHDLFETKFRDWHLQKMDYFRWCAHCAEGFLAENQRGQLMMTCPRCGKKTCFNCKKQWEDQHEGLTCEEFSQWKVDNDPTNQSVGLAKHLDENGIDCPNCKMRFALAKGGCMHFKCPQCGHEFCSGCNESYHHKNMCTKYKLCKNLGLHCHCPRDCFSFLRDYTVDQLQTLLKQHKVHFNVAPPADQQDRSHCPVMEQKEFDGEGNRDEKCGRDALHGGAGLCEIHYKEYLVVLINGQSLDPVSLMSNDEMETLLSRYDLQTPPVRSRDSPEVYKTSLVKIIKEKLPLRKR